MKKTVSVLLALLLALFALASCSDNSEAYDRGREDGYEAGYKEGQYNALEGATFYEGLPSEEIEKIYDSGYSEGYHDGYSEGSENVANSVYHDGYEDGYGDGLAEGGYDDGYAAGLSAGRDKGYAEGYNIGKSDGYSSGYAAASNNITRNAILDNSQNASNSTPAETRTPSPSNDTSVSQTVYITKTGSKYHRDGCQYLSQSKIAISLSSAKAQGYTACSKCW